MFSICRDCGSLVANLSTHEVWHASIQLQTEDEDYTHENLLRYVKLNRRIHRELDEEERSSNEQWPPAGARGQS